MTTGANGADPEPVRATAALPRPLILVRGFGFFGIDDERRNAYQGFNDGTVYPEKRGPNYIYEGFVLRALKSRRYPYTDATNVIGYYANPVGEPPDRAGFAADDVGGHTVVIDPVVAQNVLPQGLAGTIWVYRYYDLEPRSMDTFSNGLIRLIHLIRTAARVHGQQFDGVDIVAHSMGGLIVDRALVTMPAEGADSARVLVNKVVTLGTPHRGIAYQVLPRWLTERMPGPNKAADELAAFDPAKTAFLEVRDKFPVERILTIVGTNFKAYGNNIASAGNRLWSLVDEGTLASNRSDGLVKHSAAQLPGAPRTFVHKCHGGQDSLVTSREAYEISMRFFNGTHRIRLWLDDALVTRGKDFFGRSEFYLSVQIKPRQTDFDLFHQEPEANNSYGPFRSERLDDDVPSLVTELEKAFAEHGDKTTWWAGRKPAERLIWEGWIDEKDVLDPDNPEMVFRLDVGVHERDSFGVGASDNIVFRKQYFVQAFPGSPITVFVHSGEQHLGPSVERTLAATKQAAADDSQTTVRGVARKNAAASPDVQQATRTASGDWTFPVRGTGFEATFRVGIERVQPDAVLG